MLSNKPVNRTLFFRLKLPMMRIFIESRFHSVSVNLLQKYPFFVHFRSHYSDARVQCYVKINTDKRSLFVLMFFCDEL